MQASSSSSSGSDISNRTVEMIYGSDCLYALAVPQPFWLLNVKLEALISMGPQMLSSAFVRKTPRTSHGRS